MFVLSESKLTATTTLLLIAKHGYSREYDENCGLGKPAARRVSIIAKTAVPKVGLGRKDYKKEKLWHKMPKLVEGFRAELNRNRRINSLLPP